MAGVLIVVMGTSGSGKSTLGAKLAERLSLAFVDGDDLHPPSNVAKMAGGTPLGDNDREPWLHRIRETAIDLTHPAREPSADGTPRRRAGCIIACSALKKAYRDLLRGDIVTLAGQPRSDEEAGKEQALQTVHVYLDVPPEELLRRMEARSATHFMPPQLLKTQLAALEAPDPATERDVIVVKQDGQGDLQQMVQDTAKILEGYLRAP
ncbi:carbohydrate kinase [Acaromyces ingoldii]|uniref:Gluconokinase n=1 Tax=Acaromyces ingoldii TaxID=215250 RepID=A0A316YLC1_9BASI|nr:carbohydrate kinase [Acaromyces ingoldii]PWN89604.1 carbohydrate kinase [Acaromyces ingoldii]